jgi:preprotein translocase subunit SecG
MFWTNTLIDILLVIYVINCMFMGLIIMMQRSKQDGLGTTFGGGIMSEFVGAQASNVLVKATVWTAIIFFVLSITLARLYSHRAALSNETSPVLQQLTAPAAAKPGAPTTNAIPATPTAPVPPGTAATAPVSAASAAKPTPVAPATPASK